MYNGKRYSIKKGLAAYNYIICGDQFMTLDLQNAGSF